MKEKEKIIWILQRNSRPCSILAFASLGLSAYMESLSNQAAICSFRVLFFLSSCSTQILKWFHNGKTVLLSQSGVQPKCTDKDIFRWAGEIHYIEGTSLYSVPFGKAKQAVGDY